MTAVAKNKDAISWLEMGKLNSREIKIFIRRYPQMILSRLLAAVWFALSPYAVIRLSALVVEELAGGRNRERLITLVLITLSAAALTALVSALLDRWKETQNAGFWLKLEHIYAEKLLSLDYVKIDDTKTADLLSTIRQDQNSGGWGLFRALNDLEALCTAVLTLLGGIPLTISLFTSRVKTPDAYAILNSPLFILVIIAVMLAITWLAPALSSKAGSYWVIHADAHKFLNRAFGYFATLGQHRELAADVRLYRQERFCLKYTLKKDVSVGSKGIFAHLSRGPIGLYTAASSAVSQIFTGIVYAFVCLKAWAGAFGLGAVTQYIASITKLSRGLSDLFAAVGDMRNNASFLARVYAFFDIPNDMYQGSLTIEKRRDCRYEVEFRNVSFKYPGREDYALRNVSMKFVIGRHLAVVGRNGSGKTTFIKLLCRLYDPTEGEILLNGVDIRKYNYEEYMRLFSVVFQDFKLFSLKLGENVASNVDYNSAAAAESLNKAGFADRAADLEKGLETYLYKDYDKDGVNISGGEAQKIAIARAIYKDAPFIILDEPTAALDPIAETEIYTKLDSILGDKTAIFISHRLSSCKFCDEIAVFRDGRVIQQGTHAALAADETGEYYTLWQAQAQYYNE